MLTTLKVNTTLNRNVYSSGSGLLNLTKTQYTHICIVNKDDRSYITIHCGKFWVATNIKPYKIKTYPYTLWQFSTTITMDNGEILRIL